MNKYDKLASEIHPADSDGIDYAIIALALLLAVLLVGYMEASCLPR